MKTTAVLLSISLMTGLALAQTPKVEPVPNPAAAGSSQVNWSVTQDGSPLLSWVEPMKDGSFALRYAVRKGADWSEARTIAANRKFFHHPAEMPNVTALKDGTLIAEWIEQPNASSEAEFLFVSASPDGVKWSAPVMASHDKSEAQHGLASIIGTGDREASIFWLQALKGEDGPVSLMRSVISADGKELKEEDLDSDVCACCPTSVVKTAKGTLVAYRDHTKANIRDISVTRLENGKWTAPKNVYADKWEIDACPVNAASASAKGDKVAIAWYTASDDKARVELASSNDDGASFGKMTVVSTGEAYGYASTAIDDAGGAWVSWLERGKGNARLLMRHVSDAGVAGPVVEIATGTRKDLGYPHILRSGGDLWIAWNSTSKIQTARLK
ncbi:MAG TPA: sialidase family protein [Bryobacteraceae bacterium]|nr:sialidase family protein [Bryobacteraceae bacterium]